jgi:hypothetical protein
MGRPGMCLVLAMRLNAKAMAQPGPVARFNAHGFCP